MQHNKPIQWVIPIVVAMLVSVGLAGCIEIAGGSRDCADTHCITRVDNQDAQMLEEKYGIHTLRFNDDGTGKLAPRIADGAVYWQVSRRTADDTPISDIVGYDVRNQEILGVSVGTNGHSTRHEAWGDLVVFVLQHPEREHPPQLVVWNRTTMQERVLPLDMGGFLALPSDFDGSWVLLSGSLPGFPGTGRFAYNIHDGRLIHLYQQVHMGQHENGTHERLMGLTVAGGKAYYAIVIGFPDDAPGEREYNLYTNIYEHDLETDEKRLLTHRPRVGNVFMDAGSKYLAWDEGTNVFQDVYVMDRETEEILGPFNGPGQFNSLPRTEGNWVVFVSKGGDFLPPILAIHMPTGITHELLPIDSGINVPGVHTDGEFFYFNGAPFQGGVELGDALMFQFYGRLPEPEGR